MLKRWGKAALSSLFAMLLASQVPFHSRTWPHNPGSYSLATQRAWRIHISAVWQTWGHNLQPGCCNTLFGMAEL